MKEGDASGAAQEFGLAETTAGQDPIAEDASFWRAVSLSRAGRSREAAEGFSSFLARHPHSPRVGEASAALGWLLLQSGNRIAAEARFRAATADGLAEVRRSAELGLKALAGEATAR